MKEKIRKKKGSSINFYFFVFDLFILFLFQYNINHLLPFSMSRNLFKNYSALLFVYNISFLPTQNSNAKPICSFFFILT